MPTHGYQCRQQGVGRKCLKHECEVAKKVAKQVMSEAGGRPYEHLYQRLRHEGRQKGHL